MAIESYKNLCIHIEIHELIIESLNREIEELKKTLSGPKDISGIDYSKEPRAPMVPMSFDRIIERLKRLQFNIELEERVLKHKIETKKKIEAKIKMLDGLDQQVVRLRDLEGMQLQDIAYRLDKSLGYIQNISSRNKRIL